MSTWSRYSENFPFAISLDGTEDTRLPGVFVPNSDGKITVRFPVADPVRGGQFRDDRDVQIQIRVIPVSGNGLGLVDNTQGTSIGSGGGTGWETTITAATTTTPAVLSSKASRVSDNDPYPAVVKVDPEQDLRVLSESTQAYVSMVVTDQYGDRFTPWTADPAELRVQRRTAYTVGVNPASDLDTDGNAEDDAIQRPVRARGKATHNYAYGGPRGNGTTSDASVEAITITASTINLATDDISASNTSAGTATVYWATTGSKVREPAGQRIYLADTGQRLIAVEAAAGVEDNDRAPVVYEYGKEDRFDAEGREVSFGQFEQLLTSLKLVAGPDGSNANGE